MTKKTKCSVDGCSWAYESDAMPQILVAVQEHAAEHRKRGDKPGQPVGCCG